MEPKLPDDTETTDPETIALRIKRKRLRRVSFAEEITSVHIFHRDDDSSDNAPDSDSRSTDGEVVGFLKDPGGGGESDDFKDSDDDDDGGVRKPFFRPLGSPSPMSSVPGSATSNDDEDNFFGPVSTDFIRPGLCDSAASDDFHETTMDTTAFSLHYRSLARSESGGDLKTPTSFRLAFGEKTPISNNNPTDSGSLMSLTKPNNMSPPSLVSADKFRGGEDSNDMSIIEENPRKYDYGRLSPRLDALLAEGSKDLQAIRAMLSKGIKVATLDENQNGYRDQRDSRSTEVGNFDTHPMFTDPAAVSHMKVSEANGGDVSSNRGPHPSAGDSIDGQLQTPNQLIRGMEKSEATPVNGNILPNVNSKDPTLQLDVFAQDDPAFQHSNQGSVKEISLKDRRYNSNIDKLSDMEGSIALLSARSQQSILNTPNLVKHSGIPIPSSGQLGSLSNKEHTQHNEWISSVRKGISRVRMFEPSPSASRLEEEVDELKCRLSSYSSPKVPLNTVLAEVSKDLQCEFNNSPTPSPEKKLAIADLENRGQKSLISIESNGNEKPITNSKLAQEKRSTNLAKDKESTRHKFADNLSTDKLVGEAVVSPSHLSLSGSKTAQHLLMSKNPTEGTLVSARTSADEREEFLPHVKIESEKIFQTPLSSTGTQNIKLGRPGKNFQARPEPHIRTFLQSPFYKESVPRNYKSGTSPSLPWETEIACPLRDTPPNPFRKEQSASPCRKESSRSSSRKMSQREPICSSIRSLLMKEPTRTPSKVDPSSAEHTDNLRLVEKDLEFTDLYSNWRPSGDGYQRVLISQSPLTKPDADDSLGRKRRSLGITLDDGDCMDNISGSQRSSKVPRRENYDPQLMLGFSSTLQSDREKFGGESVDTTRKSWTDIPKKISGDTELLSPLTSNLNIKAIGVLEDILAGLLKAKKYEALCSEIQAQGNSISAVHKREAEARLALYRIVYEKAKLQLMRMKRDKLQSRAKLLSSAIQDSQMLKLKFNQYQSECGRGKTLVDESLRQSCSFNSGRPEQEASCDDVSTMREKLKASDGEIKSLSNFFHTHIKLKGDTSCANTISLVRDHLKTKKCCRLIKQDLQLWDIDKFENHNGHSNILLSYRGYISQRFTFNGPTSNIVISKVLNNVKIRKDFPNMDAQVAFAFVLSADVTKEITGSKCLAQETQVIGSQLCNLLDVVEEVGLARFEIVNLIQTSFLTPSADQLDLQLSFLNFKSCRKVTLSLDVTCLKRGVYPSEILPYQIQASQSAAQVPLPESLFTEIRAATEGLESGFTRIMRLCKCISHVV